jgi:membrane protease YdiL (CAAX protease family)
LVYVLMLTVAEIAVTTASPILVFPLHGGLILLTLGYVVLLAGRLMPDAGRTRLASAAVALMVAPLIRIIGLTLPLAALEPVYRYVAAGVPMAIAAVLAARAAGLEARQIGLVFRGGRWQLWAVAASIALGFVEFIVLRPQPLGPLPWTAQGLLPALATGIFTGFPEELIFRGLMQTALRPILGRWNWVYVSGVFAVLHLGYSSYLDVVFVFGVGLFYGWIFERTRSIIGVSVGHGVANIVLFFVAPNLIDPATVPVLDSLFDPVLAVALAVALTGAGVAVLRMGRGDGWRRLGADEDRARVGPLRLRVVADPSGDNVDATAGRVPADRLEVPVTARATAPASLTERRAPLGRGILRIYSSATEPLFVAAGTVFMSDDGQRFRTTKRAFLKRAPAGTRTAADVPVEAESPGVEGDVPARSIRRVPVGLATKGVAVTNPEPTRGGTQAVLRRVSAADYNAARIDAARRSWEDIRRRLAGRTEPASSQHVTPASMIVTSTSVTPDPEAIIGREAEAVELVVQRIATAVAVDLGRLREVAIDRLQSSVRDGYRLIPESVEGRVIEAVPTGTSVTYTVEVSGSQLPIGDAVERANYRAA